MVRRERILNRRVAKDKATLLIFEQMATPEMIRLRDLIMSSVVAWEKDETPKWNNSHTTATQMYEYLKNNPGKTPSEIAIATGIERNKVSARVITMSKLKTKLRLKREPSGKKDRSGLPIWRYSCA